MLCQFIKFLLDECVYARLVARHSMLFFKKCLREGQRRRR
jgi:hypothetical protein